MKHFYAVFLIGVLAGIFYSCHQDESVSLAVDFSLRDRWVYTFDVDVGGAFSRKDSLTHMATTIRSNLVGFSSNKNEYLVVRAENISIASNVLDSAEMNDIREMVRDAEYTVALKEGFPLSYDSAIVSLAGFGEWDLYRQLLKVLPSLPQKSVKPGFNWERAWQFPLRTSQGEASCEVYQSFTFDSLQAAPGKNRHACISWIFRYAVDPSLFADSSLIEQLPLSGNGKGTAVIDITEKALLKADMSFATPVCTLADLTVQWEEKACLELADKE